MVKRKDYTDSPIIIVGAARSGTSMVAGCIHLCGAWKGDTAGPNKYNAKGMFENLPLRQEILKPLLHAAGADKLGQYPLPETKDTVIPADIRESVLKRIKKQGWTSDQPWMWKCAKMSLIWPAWNFAFPDSKWIIVRRKTSDIIYSCMHTGFMNAYANKKVQKEVGVENEHDGWLYWVRKHEEKFREIIDAGINVRTVWPERMIEANYQQMKDTIEWLGLEWNSKVATEFVEPKLWKERDRIKRPYSNKVLKEQRG